MSTKAQIQQNIETGLASGSDIPASRHRETLNTVLDESYADAIIDTESTTNVFTALTGSAEYYIRINKQGRRVTLNIVVECINNYIGDEIAGITNTEFLPEEDTLSFDKTYSATGSIFEYSTDTGDTLVVSIRRDNFTGYVLSFTSNSNVLFNGQTFKGQLTYFTKD